MKLSVNLGSDAFIVPRSALNSGASDFDLLVLLRLCADFNGKTFESLSAMAADIQKSMAGGVSAKSQSDVEASLHFWRGAKIISLDLPVEEAKKIPTDDISSKSEPPKKESPALPTNRPEYSGSEAARIIDGTSGMKRMIDECQRSLGKIFSQPDINAIVALSDNLGLSNEHILMLVLYCKSKGKTSMRYIERTAYNMYDEGIDSLAALEDYIKTRERFEDDLRILRDLFGFGERALTPRENSFFNTWLVEWRLPCDMIRRAYEITVDSTDNHKLSLPYLNKILVNWHDAGYKTLAEVDEALDKYKRERDNQQSNPSDRGKPNASFDTDEFFELALKRSYEKLGGGQN